MDLLCFLLSYITTDSKPGVIMSWEVTAIQNTWSNQRRKRRAEIQAHQTPMDKQMKMEVEGEDKSTSVFIIIKLPINEIYFRISRRKSAVSDNTSSSPISPKMATAGEKFDIRSVMEAQTAYILYSGPSSSAPKSSTGQSHGSFIFSWENSALPSIIHDRSSLLHRAFKLP